MVQAMSVQELLTQCCRDIERRLIELKALTGIQLKDIRVDWVPTKVDDRRENYMPLVHAKAEIISKFASDQ